MNKPLLSFFIVLTVFFVTASAQTKPDIPKTSQAIVKKLEEKKILPQKENEIFVVGEVISPQTITTTEEITFLQVIEKVGGLTVDANEDILVIRKAQKSGNYSDVMMNIRDIKSGKEKDLAMQDGDIIVVIKKLKLSDPLKERGFPLPGRIPPKNV